MTNMVTPSMSLAIADDRLDDLVNDVVLPTALVSATGSLQTRT